MDVQELKDIADKKYDELNTFYQQLKAMPMEEREKHKDKFDRLNDEYQAAVSRYYKAIGDKEKEEVDRWAKYWINKF